MSNTFPIGYGPQFRVCHKVAAKEALFSELKLVVYS